MLANITITPDLGWIVAGFVPIALSLFAFSRSIGSLEQKVTDVAARQQDATTAQSKVQDQMLARLETLASAQERIVTKLTDHTVQDAQNFGEIRGMLTSAGIRHS